VTLNARGIHEVTTANNASDVGIVWSGIRSFDFRYQLGKVQLKLLMTPSRLCRSQQTFTIMVSPGRGIGAAQEAHSSAVSDNRLRSDQLQATRWLFPSTGGLSVKSNDNTSQPAANNALRWGIYQDTDGEFRPDGKLRHRLVQQWRRDHGHPSCGGGTTENGLILRPVRKGTKELAQN